MLDTVRVFLDAYPGQHFMGMVSEIGTSADPYTGTYEVEVQLVRKPEKLVSGFFARLRIYPLESSSGILIPYESLIDGNGLSGSVFVIRDGKAHRRNIRIERFVDEGIYIAGGLMEGEEIVVEGVRNLKDGSEVVLLD
jgi:RND family efflux transporter MFP subunit